MTRVAELLNIEYPVLQGAMGVISNPKLVAAVSEAGGYGFLGRLLQLMPNLFVIR